MVMCEISQTEFGVEWAGFELEILPSIPPV